MLKNSISETDGYWLYFKVAWLCDSLGLLMRVMADCAGHQSIEETILC